MEAGRFLALGAVAYLLSSTVSVYAADLPADPAGVEQSLWEEVFTMDGDGASVIHEYHGRLYVGEYDADGAAKIYVYDGTSWGVALQTDDEWIMRMEVYQDVLYVAVLHRYSDPVEGQFSGKVRYFDGTAWGVMSQPNAPDRWTQSLHVFQGKLFAGGTSSGGAWTKSWDGQDWVNTGVPCSFGGVEAGALTYAAEGVAYDLSSGTVTWNVSSTEMSFRPAGGFRYDTEYQFSLAPAARDLAGNALTAGYSWDFATESSLVSVEGVVLGEGGEPVEGALVSVGAQTAVTDADGAFVLTSLAPGTITVSVTAEGFEEYEVTVTAQPGEDLTLDVRLSRPVQDADPLPWILGVVAVALGLLLLLYLWKTGRDESD